jgi:AraC-like DNA-binding protein
MDRHNGITVGQHRAIEECRQALAEIPSIFGRLACLSSLRDPHSGHYRSSDFDLRFREDDLDFALRNIHEEFFQDWLQCTIAQQKADLEVFLCGLTVERVKVLSSWARLEPYRAYPPEAVDDLERRIYFGNLQVILALLANEAGAGQPASAQEEPYCKSSDPRVLQIQRWAVDQLGDIGLTLGRLSGRLQTSEGYLGRLFREHTGMSFRQYLRRIRMSRAIELLRDPAHTTKEIAAETGYTEISNFYRDFRSTFGMTPVEWRTHALSRLS